MGILWVFSFFGLVCLCLLLSSRIAKWVKLQYPPPTLGRRYEFRLGEQRYTVRDFAAGDGVQLLAIFDSNVPEFLNAQYRPVFAGTAEGYTNVLWIVIADESDKPVAISGLQYNSGFNVLIFGLVHRSHHGRGFGSLMVLLRQSLSFVEVLALETSQKTDGFYERFGFRTTSRTSNGIAPGFDAILMQMEWNEERRVQAAAQLKERYGIEIITAEGQNNVPAA